MTAADDGPPPQISVVIPAYEAADLFGAALRSALAQSGARFEIVVADDSRSDAIAAAVEAHGREGGPIRLLPGARTGNPVDNWNLGLEAARAPIKVLLHQDDLILDPLYLQRCIAALMPPQIVAGIARAQMVGVSRPSRQALVRWVGATAAGPALLPLINWIGHTAAFPFKGRHRFDRRLRWLVDVEFYSRVMAGGPIARIPGAGVRCLGHHADSISAGLDIARVWRSELAQWSRWDPNDLPPGRARLFAALVQARSLVRR